MNVPQGGPTMAMIAAKCPDIDVVVLDINEKRISGTRQHAAFVKGLWLGTHTYRRAADWQSSDLPIYEPGLLEIVKLARDRGNLHFSTDIHRHVAAADIIFVRCARGRRCSRSTGHLKSSQWGPSPISQSCGLYLVKASCPP